MERAVLSELARELGVDEERLGNILRGLIEEGAVGLRLVERYVSAEVGRVEEAVRGFREVAEQRFREIDHRFEEVNRRFEEFGEEMNRRFEEVNRRFDEFSKEMNRRFEEVNSRFGEVNRRFEEVNRRFDRLEKFFYLVLIPLALALLGLFGVFLRLLR